MRADIHDESGATMSSSQRPDTLMQDRICQIDENLLQPTAGPYIWVKIGSNARPPLCPIYPQGLTWRRSLRREHGRRHVGFRRLSGNLLLDHSIAALTRRGPSSISAIQSAVPQSDRAAQPSAPDK